MADDISKRLILVVLLITIVLSSFGTMIILQSSPASQQDIPIATGKVAIQIEPLPSEQAQANDIETNKESDEN